MNQSTISQSIDQSINQSINQSVHQSINQSISISSIHQYVEQWYMEYSKTSGAWNIPKQVYLYQLVSQSIKQSINR